MKRLFSTVMVTICVCLTACTSEKAITFEQLPADAQTLIKTHFANDPVSYVLQERERLSVEYEVRLASGSKLEFDSKGGLRKVDCDIRPVPEALIPQAVLDYVKNNFPDTTINEWGKDDRRWKAELSNKLELEFDNNYRFIRIDD